MAEDSSSVDGWTVAADAVALPPISSIVPPNDGGLCYGCRDGCYDTDFRDFGCEEEEDALAATAHSLDGRCGPRGVYALCVYISTSTHWTYRIVRRLSGVLSAGTKLACDRESGNLRPCLFVRYRSCGVNPLYLLKRSMSIVGVAYTCFYNRITIPFVSERGVIDSILGELLSLACVTFESDPIDAFDSNGRPIFPLGIVRPLSLTRNAFLLEQQERFNRRCDQQRQVQRQQQRRRQQQQQQQQQQLQQQRQYRTCEFRPQPQQQREAEDAHFRRRRRPVVEEQKKGEETAVAAAATTVDYYEEQEHATDPELVQRARKRLRLEEAKEEGAKTGGRKFVVRFKEEEVKERRNEAAVEEEERKEQEEDGHRLVRRTDDDDDPATDRGQIEPLDLSVRVRNAKSIDDDQAAAYENGYWRFFMGLEPPLDGALLALTDFVRSCNSGSGFFGPYDCVLRPRSS